MSVFSKSSRMVLQVVVSLSVLTVGTSLHAQRAVFPAFQGSEDQGLRFPHIEKPQGTKDSGAVAVLREYFSAIAPTGVDGWCLSGTMTIGNGTRLPAAFFLDGAGRARLDMTAPTGTRSIRMDGAVGGIVQEDGSILRYPAATARAGLFPTPGLLKKVLAEAHSTWSDDGEVTIANRRYRSVTFSQPVNPQKGANSLTPPAVTQLLFDPSTHLLIKAIDSVVLSQSSRTQHLRVMTFSNYQQHDHDLIPSQLTETRDGQLSWNFALSSADPGCTKDSQFFAVGGGDR